VAERLRLALNRFERALADHEVPVVQGLLPGVDESEVRQMLAEVDIEPPDDLIDWFGWHNGYAPPRSGKPFWNIGPSQQAIGLERAYDIYTELRHDIDELAPDEDTEWFLVINFTHNGYILMYCGDKADRRGQVACWMAEFPDGFYRPATLAEPVEWWMVDGVPRQRVLALRLAARHLLSRPRPRNNATRTPLQRNGLAPTTSPAHPRRQERMFVLRSGGPGPPGVPSGTAFGRPEPAPVIERCLEQVRVEHRVIIGHPRQIQAGYLGSRDRAVG
jgi:hypothetical protein